MKKKQVIQAIIDCFRRGNKLLIIGNGGSAAMSQHFAAEFICKFEKNRMPLPAIALTTDTSILTAVSNDYDFQCIFDRQIRALGKPNDILIIFSTSGKSQNCILANIIAKSKLLLVVEAPRKGNSTAHIQEKQLKWMHDVVREVEKAFI